MRQEDCIHKDLHRKAHKRTQDCNRCVKESHLWAQEPNRATYDSLTRLYRKTHPRSWPDRRKGDYSGGRKHKKADGRWQEVAGDGRRQQEMANGCFHALSCPIMHLKNVL